MILGMIGIAILMLAYVGQSTVFLEARYAGVKIKVIQSQAVPVPVSYTHLDVYKRQPQVSPQP